MTKKDIKKINLGYQDTTKLFNLLGNILSINEIDKLSFEELNSYRMSNEHQQLQWDELCYEAAIHHSKYMLYNDKCTHDEEKTKFKTPEKRVLYYAKKKEKRVLFFKSKNERKKINEFGENVILVPMTTTINDSSINSKIAKLIIEEWKTSKGHNKNMLRKSYTHGACSVSLYVEVNDDEILIRVYGVQVFIGRKYFQ